MECTYLYPLQNLGHMGTGQYSDIFLDNKYLPISVSYHLFCIFCRRLLRVEEI